MPWICAALIVLSTGCGSPPTPADEPAAVIGSLPADALALATSTLPGEPDSPRDLSLLLDAIRAEHDVPGMVGCIVTRDALTAIGAAGVRKRGAKEVVEVDDQFHLGSCTKSMTATLCAILVEQKHLDWTKPLSEYFPELESMMQDGYKSVTLHQLLSNHGGFPNQLLAHGLWSTLLLHSGTEIEARRKLLEGVVAHPPAAPPGTKYIYSNAGFSVAGHLAEVVMRRPYEELMETKLFAPLGIESAGFGAPGTQESVDQPRGHRENGVAVEPGRRADNPTAIAPAGRVHMTIADWGKYVQLHLRGAVTDTKLLPAKVFAKLHEPVGENYACGWLALKRPWGGRVLNHNGSNTMWYAVTWLAPEKGFAVLIACNQGGTAAAKACDAAAGALIRDHLSR